MRRHSSHPGQQLLPFPVSNEPVAQDGVAIEPLNRMLAFAQMGTLPGSTPATIASAFTARGAPVRERVRIAASLPVHVSGTAGPSKSAQIAIHEARRLNSQHSRNDPHHVRNSVDTLMQILHTRIAINGTSEEARRSAVTILRASGCSRSAIKKLLDAQAGNTKRGQNIFSTTNERLAAAHATVESTFNELEAQEMAVWMQPLLEETSLIPPTPPSPPCSAS